MIDRTNNLYEFYAKGMEDNRKLKWGQWGHIFYIQCTEEIAKKLLKLLTSVTQHCKKPQELDKKTWLKLKRIIRIMTSTRLIVYPIPFEILEKELGIDIANWIVVNDYKKTVTNQLIPNGLEQWYKYWEIETFQDLSILLKKIVSSRFENPLILRDKICEIAEDLEWSGHVITCENILEGNQ
jgi:hypothetical protein